MGGRGSGEKQADMKWLERWEANAKKTAHTYLQDFFYFSLSLTHHSLPTRFACHATPAHKLPCPTDRFALLQPQNPSIQVSEQHKI